MGHGQGFQKSSVITVDFIDTPDDLKKANALNKIWESDFAFGKPVVSYVILSRPNGSKVIDEDGSWPL